MHRAYTHALPGERRRLKPCAAAIGAFARRADTSSPLTTLCCALEGDDGRVVAWTPSASSEDEAVRVLRFRLPVASLAGGGRGSATDPLRDDDERDTAALYVGGGGRVVSYDVADNRQLCDVDVPDGVCTIHAATLRGRAVVYVGSNCAVHAYVLLLQLRPRAPAPLLSCFPLTPPPPQV